MSKIYLPPAAGISLSRRRFVQGLAAGGRPGPGYEPASWPPMAEARMGPQILSGSDFDLSFGPTPVNFTGAERLATAINGSLPAPILRWREGDTVTLRVTNRLPRDSSIHWHGIILPERMDGVPGISFGFTASPRARPSPIGSRSARAAPTGTTAIPGSRSRPACTAPSSSIRGSRNPSPPTATTW